MKIDWFTNQNNSGVITVYSNNITLNKQATDYLKDSFCVIVGVNRESNELVIKGLSKEEVEQQDISKDSIKKLSVKKSYSRITGKSLVDEVSKVYDFNFNECPAYKLSAKWNNRYKMLIATYENEVK